MQEKPCPGIILSMIEKILTSLIIGDALGSAVDGMTRGHVNSHFRVIDDYIDPEPALKNKTEQWRKPGLYSSITQLMLIMALSCPRRGPCADGFRRSVASTPDVDGYEYGIFRYPGAVEKAFIARMKDPSRYPHTPEQPCARIIPALTFLSFRNNRLAEHILDITSMIRLFTLDYSTLAAALIYSSLLRTLSAAEIPAADTLRVAVDAAAHAAEAVESNSAAVFAEAANPGTLAGELRAIRETLSETMSADSLKAAEDTIVARVNRKLKTPVTRATVNHPAALFPYALAVASFSRTASVPLIPAVSGGGSTAALAAMAGAIGACRPDAEILPPALTRNLVNRKKVLALAAALSTGSTPPDTLEEFIHSEASLTDKEQEELGARLKHARKKPKRTALSRAEKEKELARHAVESWTKLDKARWKKEKRHHDKKDES